LPQVRSQRGGDAAADAGAAIVAVRRIVRALRLAEREVEDACGISVAQLFVLHQLAAAPALSVGELAARVLTDQSSVSTVVARLVTTGYVARRPAPGDRRRVELRLTAQGERALAASPPIPQLRLIDAIRALPARRRREVVRALATVATALGARTVEARMLFED